jgi:hypothetical protein
MNTSNIVDMIRSDPTIPDDIPGFVARMNAPTIPHINARLQDTKSILQILGPTDTAKALGGLKAAAATNPLLDSIFTTISTIGINFADPITQGMIDQLVGAGALSADLGAKCKALGVTYTALCDAYGGLCTTQNVTDAIALLAQEPLHAEVQRRVGVVSGLISSGQVTDIPGIVAAFGAA